LKYLANFKILVHPWFPVPHNKGLTLDRGPGLPWPSMRILMHIRSLLVTSLMIAVLAIVPTVSAAYAHSCCIEAAGKKTAELQQDDLHAGHEGNMAASQSIATDADMASMAHHQKMQDNDCEAVCCGTLIVYGLTFNATVASDSWDGLGHVYSTDNTSVSAAQDHNTPPPRLA